MALYLGTDKINEAKVGIEANLQYKSAQPSSTLQTISPDSGYTGLAQVTISAATLQTKTVTPTVSSQIVTADSGYYGLSKVDVGAVPLATKTITENGTYNASSDNVLGYSSVDVNVTTGIPRIITNDTSVSPSGTYASSTYYDTTYGVKVGYTGDGGVLISMMSGSTTGYEKLYFYTESLPSGASLTATNMAQSYTSANPASIYACLVTGLSQTSTYTLSLAMNTRNSTYDYTRVDITIS